LYNLIITAQEGAWEGRPCELDITRVIRTFTDDDLKEKYKLLDAAAVSELQSFPALFAYEDQLQAEAHVGFITAVRRRGDDIKIEYRFWEDVPPIPASKLKELSWDLDIDKKLEINHTHWAVKRIDLLDVLVEAGLVTPEQISRIPARLMNAAIPGASRQMLVTPLVFDIIEVPRETDLVAVMMPFQAEFNPVYTAIQAACRHTGLRCQRADDVW